MTKTEPLPSIDAEGAVTIDVPRLIVTRLLVEASSGGGKSWLLRRILEVTFGHAQHIVIDYDGEFHTLREKFDYILVGPGGDCPADVRSAALLARRLLELGVSAVIDISDLGTKRALYVKTFIESLMTAPRDLWHDVLIAVDECHKLAPEKGAGEAESTEAIKDLATRGRKRGFSLVAATQRVSELHKTVIAELANKLIGRTSLDLDIDRARSMLGMTKADAYRDLPQLEDGTFYAFGPALSREVTLVKVGPVVTTHPTAGQRSLPPTAPRARVKQILSQLADLPAEAQAEAQTVEELRAQVKQLKDAAVTHSWNNPDSAKQLEEVVVLRGRVRALEAIQDVNRQAAEDAFAAIGEAATQITAAINLHHAGGESRAVGMSFRDRHAARGRVLVPRGDDLPDRNGRPVTELADSGIVMTKMERTFLACLAQRRRHLSRKELLTFTGYRNSGTVGVTFANILRKHWAELVGSDLQISPTGLAALGSYTPLPTGRDLRNLLLGDGGKLSTLERAILSAICSVYPDSTTRKQVLETTGYKNSGTVGVSFAKLIALGYVDKSGGGMVVANKELF